MADRADWEDVDGMSADASAHVAADIDDSAVDWAPQEDVVDDDPFANAFTDEIVNVTASDWDVDADALWGADASPDVGFDPGPGAYDFPV